MIVIAGQKGRQLYVSEVVVISARNSEVNQERDGCRTVCHPILEKFNKNEECVSIFDGQPDETEKTQIIDIFDQ